MKITKIEWRNFSSYGNRTQELNLGNESSLFQINGENGTGKCLYPDTILKVKVSKETLAKINNLR